MTTTLAEQLKLYLGAILTLPNHAVVDLANVAGPSAHVKLSAAGKANNRFIVLNLELDHNLSTQQC
jgi:hypothetical protein